MAAVVASPQVATRNLDADYLVAGGNIDGDGEKEAQITYAMGDVTMDDAENESSGSDGDAGEGSGEDEDENMEPEDDDDEVVRIPNGQADVESDEDAVVENVSEVDGSSAEEEADDSDKDSSSDAESAIAREWEGGSADDAEVEVATRNNCV